jgi:hypothetical protein
MKCKYCQAKVLTLHGGYCGPCKRNGFAEKIKKPVNQLSQFTTSELEQELLNRQKCSFGRLSCTEKAQDYMTKPQNPTCFNCKQDILSLENSHGN